jgi:predicted RNase H-like nuclease (RuvC/YqgF family)
VTSLPDDRDALIAELYEEAHGLRMKFEEFSRYTEDAMARMATERRASAERHSTMERDMEVRDAERHQLQAELKACRDEIARLAAELERLRTPPRSPETRRWGRRSR